MGVCVCVLMSIAAVATFLAIFKIYMKLTAGWNRSPVCLVGKTAIVTGANVGIGYNTALDFAMRGGRVILACRNMKKAEAARAKIVKETGNENVVVKILDTSSLASVRAFAKDINATEKRLDILVNNAGATGLGHHTTEDGLELMIATNHLGPFLLTNLLIDLLKKSAPSRIVNVASEAAFLSTIDPNNINSYPNGPAYIADWVEYCKTKRLNIMFTQELARKLKNSGVTTNTLHPGAVDTNFLNNMPKLIRPAARLLAAILFKTSLEGAQTTLYLALSKDVEDISGEYFVDCRKRRMPSQARDEGVVKKVWEKSEELVKLSSTERTV